MPNRFLDSVGRSPNRRIALVTIGLACLLALAAATAVFTGRTDHPTSRPAASPTSPSPHRHSPPPKAQAGSVPRPPRTSDPVKYAKAAARMLWSYNTRHTRRSEQLAGMKAWMTTESRYRDVSSVVSEVPAGATWARMADQHQRASATAAEGHFPDAFKRAVAEDPSAIRKAYIYAVTVTGKQRISWKKHGGGAEDRAATLAVQCRPSHSCSLVALAPRVAP